MGEGWGVRKHEEVWNGRGRGGREKHGGVGNGKGVDRSIENGNGVDRSTRK